MVLYGQDDGVGRGHEGALLDGHQHLAEADLGGEGVAVVDDREPVVPVPAVQLHTAAAGQQGLVTQASVIVGGAGWCTWRYISTQDLPPNCLPDR